MEFGIFTIGPSPAVLVADIASSLSTTILMMRIMKFAGADRRLHPENGKPRMIWILSVFLVWIVFSLLSVIALHTLFVSSINFLIGPGICTVFVMPGLLERLIPIVGGLFAAARNIDTKLFKILRGLLAFFFPILVLVSLWTSVYENIFLFSNFLTSMDSESASLVAWNEAFNLVAFGVTSCIAVLISFRAKRFGNSSARIFSASKKTFFIFGALISSFVGNSIYASIYWYLTHQISELSVCETSGFQWFPLAAFTVTWLLRKNAKTKPVQNLPTKIKLDQIKSVTACPAMWDDMLGDDKVRYCHLCGKQTYSLNELTPEEAEELRLRQSIYVRKDRAIMESDCFVGLTSIQKATIQLQRYVSQLRNKVSQ